MIWIGFLLSVALLILVSRRDLALGMAVAAGVLALFTHTWGSFGTALWTTVSSPSVLLLSLVVGAIPLIGGVMQASGEMDRLVDNLRMGIRPFLALGPALLGMLPMPGGALLSAPLVERGAGSAPPDIKAAANTWFRHVMLLIYPLGAEFIASAKVAQLDVYSVIPYLMPTFLLMVLLGYIFLLRRVSGRLPISGPFALRGLLIPLGIILAAPVLDFLLKRSVVLPYTEIGTAAGVALSLAMAIGIGRIGMKHLGRITRKAAPWKYMLIILAMFAFLNTFRASGVPEQIQALSLSPVLLCVVIATLLGLITGRMQAPMSIIIPIYMTTYGPMSGTVFAITYFSVFLGFILTPVHPCISVSLQYFKISLHDFLKQAAIPAAAAWVITLLVALLVF
jgi:uncharacterized protein